MDYNISFREDVESAFENLSREEVNRVQDKLEEVANHEFRSPEDWFKSWNKHPAGNRFDIGPYRVFAEVNTCEREIIVHETKYRENLYRG
jgi:mRNA-degrading endonuclease RelE of RelBE toxin-antitoxin system